MTTADEIRQANIDGRNAEVGAQNPHVGNEVLARAWRLGYQTMLVDMIDNSPARQAFRNTAE